MPLATLEMLANYHCQNQMVVAQWCFHVASWLTHPVAKSASLSKLGALYAGLDQIIKVEALFSTNVNQLLE